MDREFEKSRKLEHLKHELSKKIEIEKFKLKLEEETRKSVLTFAFESTKQMRDMSFQYGMFINKSLFYVKIGSITALVSIAVAQIYRDKTSLEDLYYLFEPLFLFAIGGLISILGAAFTWENYSVWAVEFGNIERNVSFGRGFEENYGQLIFSKDIERTYRIAIFCALASGFVFGVSALRLLQISMQG